MSSQFPQQNVVSIENEWAIRSLTILRAVLMGLAMILIFTALKHGRGLSVISSANYEEYHQVETSSL